MDFSTALYLLRSALVLLTLVQLQPSLPESTRFLAINLAQQATTNAVTFLSQQHLQSSQFVQSIQTSSSPSPAPFTNPTSAPNLNPPPYPSPYSTQSTTPNCTFNGQFIADGTSIIAYQSASVPSGSQCVSQTRTCYIGVLSGTYANPQCSVPSSPLISSTPTAQASCPFNGQMVLSGATITAYQAATVPTGSQCVSETRACTNGTLSGSYTNASCAVAVAAQASRIGFNTPGFLFDYAMEQGYPYSYQSDGGLYSDSYAPTPLSTITGYLDFLKGQGITSVREILPGLSLEDTSGVFAPSSVKVMQAYQVDGFTVVVALGDPSPGETSRINGQLQGSCFNVNSDADWQALANRYANNISNWLLYLERNGIDPTWLQSHVIIEPYNEFDGARTYNSATNQCTPYYEFGTPKDAVVLYKAVVNKLVTKDLANEVTMPSLVVSNNETYLQQYYAAGGGGRPNLHDYPSNSSLVSANSSEMENINKSFTYVPAQYRGKAIMGEFGAWCTYPPYTTTKSDSCISEAAGAVAIPTILSDPNLTSNFSMMLYWDLFSRDWLTVARNSTPSPTLASFNKIGQAILSIALSQAPGATQGTASNGIVAAGNRCPLAYTGTYPVCMPPWYAINSSQLFYQALYACVLNRQPDDSIDASTAKTLANSYTEPKVLNIYKAFFLSSEYINKKTTNDTFVNQMYECVLFRHPDDAGKSYWLAQLNNGVVTRDSLLSLFVQSDEFKNKIDPVVQAALTQ